MTTETGGPAFPSKQKALLIEKEHAHIAKEIEIDQNGMTLRDYFAAQVAVGAMSAYWNGDRMRDPTFGDIAQQAYGIADAMLEARKA
jgi:hypothetical protein